MNVFNDLKTGTTLIMTFLVTALIIVALAFEGYLNIKSVNDGMTTMYTDRLLPKPYSASEVYHCLSKQLGVLYSYKGLSEHQTQDKKITAKMLYVLPDALCSELIETLGTLEQGRIEAAIQQVAIYDKALHSKLN